VGNKVVREDWGTSGTDHDLWGPTISQQIGFICLTQPLADFWFLPRKARLIGRLDASMSCRPFSAPITQPLSAKSAGITIGSKTSTSPASPHAIPQCGLRTFQSH